MIFLYTSSWLVAFVCFLIIALSFGFERVLFIIGVFLTRANRKHLYAALQKIKEELMVLGFISLLLELVPINTKILCVPKSMRSLLPCDNEGEELKTHTCKDDQTLLFSQEDLKDLHEFLFVLAIVHVILSVLTVLFGEVRMRKWGRWEESYAKAGSAEPRQRFVLLHEVEFIKRRYTGIRTYSTFLGWVQCFLRQFYRPVAISDYETLRRGFITAHCKGNQRFNFHNYLQHVLEEDFETVVGISWYLWIAVVIFLLINVYGWKTYLWMAFVPIILLLAIGTKLEHVMTQLAHDVAEKNTIIEGELVVTPSDKHFWFHRPQLILVLIHFLLFQNAFEITFLMWYLIQIRFDECASMSHGRFIITARIITGVIIRIFCSYSTLPLYALITQMGTQIKHPIFEENMNDNGTSTDELLLLETADGTSTYETAKVDEENTHVETDIGTSNVENAKVDEENTHVETDIGTSNIKERNTSEIIQID